VANRSKGRRGRPRKRRRGAAPLTGQGVKGGLADEAGGEHSEGAQGGAGKQARASAPRRSRASRTGEPARTRGVSGDPRGRATGIWGAALAVGERPQPPWHPLPLSEILILVGAIGTVVGLNKGVSHGGPPLFAGLAAVVLGTAEVTLREHWSGYRSHAVMLALLATIAFHTAVVFGIAAFTPTPRIVNVALLAVDLALFAFLFKLLRSRFLDARRERVFTGTR
jgi:hypothetical protein